MWDQFEFGLFLVPSGAVFVIAAAPVVAPYGYLLWMMRGIAVTYLMSSCIRLASYYDDDYLL